jgi:hypothetical protein
MILILEKVYWYISIGAINIKCSGKIDFLDREVMGRLKGAKPEIRVFRGGYCYIYESQWKSGPNQLYEQGGWDRF